MDGEVKDMSDVFLEYGKTVLHPVAIAFMICTTLLVLFGNRQRAAMAILATCIFMPTMQRLVIAGLDFSMMRLIIMAGWVKVAVSGYGRGFRMGSVDRAFLAWALSVSIFHVLREGSSAIVYRLGTSFDTLALFFLFRLLVRTFDEVALVVRQLAQMTIILGFFMVYEWISQHNLFSIFGGAPEISVIRDGKVRAQGPFSHPILTGTYAGAVFPLFAAMARTDLRRRGMWLFAILFTALIVRSSGSSGPIITWGIGLIGWGLWLVRKQMPVINLAVVASVLLIHVVRSKPVWHLIGRLAELTGGTGYHRYLLIDAFMTNWKEWIWVGTSETGHWGWGLQDTTNQYIAEGIQGGIVALIAFIVLLLSCFHCLRLGRNLAERSQGALSEQPLLLWGFSVALASHCVSFVSVSYFGQMLQMLVIFFALIPAVSLPRALAPHARAP